MSATIWVNKYLSNTWEILALLLKVRRPQEYRMLCTHPRAHYAGRRLSDLFEQEPEGLDDRDYVAYCLDVAQRYAVSLFLPGRNILPILRARGRFESLGTQILAAADADTWVLLQNKAAVYTALKGTEFLLPDYSLVGDLAGFDAAWDRLRPRHNLLCYKPAVSVYGLGFRILAERGPALESLLAGDPLYIRLEDARRAFAGPGRFRELLVMPYLPGPERSVDCLAQDGELIRCVVRCKHDGGQRIEDNPGIVAVVRRLAAHFRLTNLFNVQFRDSGGRSYLLEINARMSGGLPFACRSGLVLPYWAVRLALATASPEDVPSPCTGVWIPQPEPVSSL